MRFENEYKQYSRKTDSLSVNTNCLHDPAEMLVMSASE